MRTVGFRHKTTASPRAARRSASSRHANPSRSDNWQNYQAGWRIIGGQVTQTTVTNERGHQFAQQNNKTMGSDTIVIEITVELDSMVSRQKALARTH